MTSTTRLTQCDRILELLKGRDKVPLPELLALRISQYGARIRELRRRGYQIESGSDWQGGKRYTSFRLLASTEVIPHLSPSAEKPSELLFPDAPPRHLDLG
jgi:hypothetical protein